MPSATPTAVTIVISAIYQRLWRTEWTSLSIFLTRVSRVRLASERPWSEQHSPDQWRCYVAWTPQTRNTTQHISIVTDNGHEVKDEDIQLVVCDSLNHCDKPSMRLTHASSLMLSLLLTVSSSGQRLSLFIPFSGKLLIKQRSTFYGKHHFTDSPQLNNGLVACQMFAEESHKFSLAQHAVFNSTCTPTN